jgi:alginate O-acetyltransferase complex protein AlgI
MLFNSPEFLLVFLPISFALFMWARQRSARLALTSLLASSLVFYGVWNWRYLPLLCGSVVLNWYLAKALVRSRSRILLAIGVTFNVSLLLLFKYADFLGGALYTALGWQWQALEWVLPLALSFYTFQQITFLADSYRRIIGEVALKDYFLAIAFFPHLIAGPIVQPKELLPQFAQLHPRIDHEHLARGLVLVILGLAKKVLIADPIASYVDPAFAQPSTLNFVDAWTAALGYSLQLYFDFSAYSEIAIGLALMMGFRLPVNFNAPYEACDIQDFWRRWHITLGRFLREYIYVPLGGNRCGVLRTCAAITVTFAIGGLWHGAGWQFLVWGLMHAAFLVAFVLWQRFGITLPRAAAWLLTFGSVSLAWVMFRSNSVADALVLYETMFGLRGVEWPILYQGLPGFESAHFVQSPFFSGAEIIVLIGLLALTANTRGVLAHATSLTPTKRVAIGLAALTGMVLLNLGQATSFLYFNF